MFVHERIACVISYRVLQSRESFRCRTNPQASAVILIDETQQGACARTMSIVKIDFVDMGVVRKKHIIQVFHAFRQSRVR